MLSRLEERRVQQSTRNHKARTTRQRPRDLSEFGESIESKHFIDELKTELLKPARDLPVFILSFIVQRMGRELKEENSALTTHNRRVYVYKPLSSQETGRQSGALCHFNRIC